MGGLVVMVLFADRGGEPCRIVSRAVFSRFLSLFCVISALYHSVRDRRRSIFRILDQALIYIVIAGTFTPFTLVTLREGKGWVLFEVIWGMAVGGAAFKSFATHRLRILAPVFYIVLGGWSL